LGEFIVAEIITNNKKIAEFSIEMTKLLKKTTDFYSLLVKEISKIQNNYESEYGDFKESQKSTTGFLETLDDMDEKQTKNTLLFFKILIKYLSIEQKMRRIWFLTSKEQEDLAIELKDISDEMDNIIKQIKEIKG